jgi:methylenetetrahydrofolate--tRNA-(uracil-5-)-methyltransferase
MMGVEGYTESIALGRLTALLLSPGPPVSLPPPATALGALVRALVPAAYREEGTPPGPEETGRFSPVNLHFGLFPPLPGRVRGGKAERRKAQVVRAREAFDRWWESVRRRG